MERILIIGNSHSLDAFQLLSLVYSDQEPEEEVTLGILYYSGCPISKHVDFGKNEEAVCRYYKNINGVWNIERQVDMDHVLFDEPWEKVFLQPATPDLDETFNRPGRRELEKMVDERVATPHKFYWHTSWPSPDDPYFFTPDKNAPQSYVDRLVRLFDHDPIKQFTILTNKAKENILTDEAYEKAICTGAAIMNAHFIQGCPQREIWRDYTHLSDFGRLLASYAFYVQLTGRKLEKVGVSLVPVELRNPKFQEAGELKITEEMKDIILKAANYALDEPWSVCMG